MRVIIIYPGADEARLKSNCLTGFQRSCSNLRSKPTAARQVILSVDGNRFRRLKERQFDLTGRQNCEKALRLISDGLMVHHAVCHVHAEVGYGILPQILSLH